MALGDKANSQATNNSRVQQGAAGADTREKAVAFINIDFPTKSGEKKRLVSFGLMASDPFHQQLIDFLNDPVTRDANIEKVTAKLIGSVNFIKTGEAALLDL